jgi:GDP-4-dehydro-6-deoxy-D-mannose reductase
MRILVTGINGFVGRHLAADLVGAGHEVIGVGVGGPSPDVVPLLTEYLEKDLVHAWPTMPRVDGIVHLAALSTVGDSFDQPQRYISTNSSMITNLGEYLLAQAHPPTVLLVSSGAVYSARQSMPIAELGSIAFNSPYAISKVLTENQATYYSGRGLNWIVARPFNHIGPGQASGFLLPDLYDAYLRHRSTLSPMIVGDLTTQRDFTDVRDVVRAYRLILEADTLDSNLFNICSGRPLSGQDILDQLLSVMGSDAVPLQRDPGRLRPNDPALIVGNADVLARSVGWAPEIELARTVRDFVSTAGQGSAPSRRRA